MVRYSRTNIKTLFLSTIKGNLYWFFMLSEFFRFKIVFFLVLKTLTLRIESPVKYSNSSLAKLQGGLQNYYF